MIELGQLIEVDLFSIMPNGDGLSITEENDLLVVMGCAENDERVVAIVQEKYLDLLIGKKHETIDKAKIPKETLIRKGYTEIPSKKASLKNPYSEANDEDDEDDDE